jgi:hypothetical protein
MPLENQTRDLFHPLCGARTRGGRPCHRYPVAGSSRCHRHGGRSTGAQTPEGRAAQLAGYAAWVAKTRAKISRGELDRFPTGRKPRDPAVTLKRKLRARALRASPDLPVGTTNAQDASTWDIRFIDPPPPGHFAGGRPPWPRRTGGGEGAVLLERAERSWITRINDRHPPPPAVVERVYDHLRQAEAMIGPADGQRERLVRLVWEFDNWNLRRIHAETRGRGP